MAASTGRFGPRETITITLSLDTIRNNRCDQVPEVALVYGERLSKSDTVTYRLDDDAAALWKFRWPGAISLKDGKSSPSMDCLKVDPDKDFRAIELCLKPKSAHFQTTALLFHFESRDPSQPATERVLDPIISSRGGPRI